MISGSVALAELVRTAAGSDAQGAHRMLPVAPELSGLLPGRGLRRGSTVAVAGGRAAPAGGGTSLMLALLAAASRSGSWCAVVGVPALGALAAAESGVELGRLALVPNPGPDWPTVVAALIDGVDVVVAAVPGPVSANIAGRLAARARQRGSVLVPFGEWSGADLTLQVDRGRWEGLGPGRGRLRRREVTVVARGRGAAARPREITLWMPGVVNRAMAVPPVRSSAEPENPLSELTGVTDLSEKRNAAESLAGRDSLWGRGEAPVGAWGRGEAPVGAWGRDEAPGGAWERDEAAGPGGSGRAAAGARRREAGSGEGAARVLRGLPSVGA